MGVFATVAVQKPENLAIAVIDNERYGETGEQLTHSAFGTDLAAIARGAGIADAGMLMDMPGVSAFRDSVHTASGPMVGVIKVVPQTVDMVLPPRDGIFLKHRFRGALGAA